MLYRIIKWLFVGGIIVAGIYGLFNFDYVTKQIGYFFNRTFITDQQRDNLRAENPVESTPNQLQIPSVDIVAPIVYAKANNEAAYQEALIDGVVYYPNTGKLGQIGNVYIFGHSSDFAFSKGNYKTVFALLPKVNLGEKIYVTDEDGDIYIYEVFDRLVVEKNDTSVLSQDTKGKKILTLQTSYPIGTALKRYIVKAELVER